ncbi:MAG: hypothetical protein GQ544_10150 [Candidatus Aminicenantes bacterium]|nr:hypothetical protein [Candidatus Aminicenantes bacterium]
MFRLMIVTMAIVLMFQPYPLIGEEKVVIGVAADGDTLEAAVSHLAARAPYFLIVNDEGKLMEAVANPYKDNRGGAGVSAANFLAEKNVTVVVAGNFGNKMINALADQEIAHFEFEGRVAEAIQEVLRKDERP